MAVRPVTPRGRPFRRGGRRCVAALRQQFGASPWECLRSRDVNFFCPAAHVRHEAPLRGYRGLLASLRSPLARRLL